MDTERRDASGRHAAISTANPQSKTTPLLIIFNASVTYKGFSLNDSQAKGPDVLVSMLGFLLRFRQDIYAIVGDIAKMYNAVEISDRDQHLHRFLWRSMDGTRDPDPCFNNSNLWVQTQ